MPTEVFDIGFDTEFELRGYDDGGDDPRFGRPLSSCSDGMCGGCPACLSAQGYAPDDFSEDF